MFHDSGSLSIMGRLQSDWYLTRLEAGVQGKVTLGKYGVLHAC